LPTASRCRPWPPRGRRRARRRPARRGRSRSLANRESPRQSGPPRPPPAAAAVFEVPIPSGAWCHRVSLVPFLVFCPGSEFLAPAPRTATARFHAVLGAVSGAVAPGAINPAAGCFAGASLQARARGSRAARCRTRKERTPGAPRYERFAGDGRVPSLPHSIGRLELRSTFIFRIL